MEKIVAGFYQSFKNYLKHNPDMISLSALMYAADINNNKIIPFLVNNLKLNVNQLNLTGNTAVHYAARAGNSKIIAELHKLGADLKIHNSQGRTALHLAAQFGRIACVDYLSNKLLNSNYNVDIIADKKITPLMLAAQYGHISCVTLLVNKGANIYATSQDKVDAMHLTIMSKSNTPMLSLPKHVSQPLKSQYLAIIKYLLQSGYNINHIGDLGIPIIVLAILQNQSDLVALFVNYNADLTIRDTSNSQTALDYAIFCKKDSNEILNIIKQKIKELIKNICQQIKNDYPIFEDIPEEKIISLKKYAYNFCSTAHQAVLDKIIAKELTNTYFIKSTNTPRST